MHGLTGGGWKRKRYRPWSKRKLPVGKPQAGAPRPTAEPFATAPAAYPPQTLPMPVTTSKTPNAPTARAGMAWRRALIQSFNRCTTASVFAGVAR